MEFQKLSIRTQILISFAVIATISLIILSTLAIGNVTIIGDRTKEKATNALEQQIIRNINISSSENAQVITSKFHNAEAAVRKIVDATQTIFSSEVNFNSIQSYHDTELLSIPDVQEDPIYGENISTSTSTYYYPDPVNKVLTASMNGTIDKSAHLDRIFSSIHEKNPNYVWLYVAFSDGVFRNFPGARVDVPALPVALNYEWYDPPREDWYTEAVQARGDLVYSAPYFDITQGLVVSLTQAVYVNNIPIAVVGLDFKVTVIRDKVLDISFLDTGYAALFQTTDLTLVAHPKWDADAHEEEKDLPLISDYEINRNGGTVLNLGIIDTITNGNGVTEYDKNNERYFLAYAQILTNKGDVLYTFIISVLASEAVKSVKVIEDEIVTSQSSVMGLTIVISIITLIGTLFIGIWLAANITKPIGKLTKIAEQITRNATSDDLFTDVDFEDIMQSEDEIGDLSRSFNSMVKHLREEQQNKGKKK